jgi:hypothetical protein
VALEVNIERRGSELLVGAGCICLKMGNEGYPDRLVIWGPGRHFWIEWKAPGGRLTAAQRARIPRLRHAGEPVYICTAPEQAIQSLWMERGGEE